MKTYENNMADQALIVKSLKVLDKIEGGGVTEIKNDVEAVRRQTVAQNKKQEEFWKQFSDDGVISVIEKQSLYRESQNIDRSYAAITQQATALQIESSIMADYIATYNALHTYLYTTLKLFDDMSSETIIDDRDTFNGYFSGYYFDENFVLLAITAGILDSIDFRVLESLTEPGTEGETAIYRGGLYQYINGSWKNVSTGAYKGPRTELPPDEEGAFFIVSQAFTLTQGLIVNGEELYVNGDLLGVVSTYLKGYIYYYEDGTWHPVFDKTDWRYAAAFADVINITGELPQIFQDAIDDLQDQIDTKADAASLAAEIEARENGYTIINGDIVQIGPYLLDLVEDINQEIEDNVNTLNGEIATKISHLPVYLGAKTSAPSGALQGDFYLNKASGNDYLKIKRYNQNAWETLDPSLQANRNYYMIALEDILAADNAGTGTFTQLFCQAFWTASADVDTLDVKTIFLRQTGKIQSAETVYDSERVGLMIDANGNIDANGDVHLGATSTNKVAIGVSLKNSQGQYQPDFNNYDCVIGGRTRIRGVCVIDGNSEISGNAIFKGDIEAGPLRLLSETPSGETQTYNVGDRRDDISMINVIGTYMNYNFDRFSITSNVPYWELQYTDSEYRENREHRRVLWIKNPSSKVHTQIILFNNGTRIASLERLRTISLSGWYTKIDAEEYFDNQAYFIMDYVLTWTRKISPDAKTFRLIDLPTDRPSGSGYVWNNNGVLNITP